MKSKEIPFVKMHGLGNSYIYVDLFQNELDEESLSDLAIQISSSSTGIGSDGLILICPSQKADVKMRIFNKDGSEAKNCGNGLRCVAKYVYENKLCKPNSKQISIETLSGVALAEIVSWNHLQAQVSVNMGQPKLARKEIPMIGSNNNQVISEKFHIGENKLVLTAVSMGNPHAVFFVQDPNHCLHQQLGPAIEHDPLFPERINVEFVYVEKESKTLRCKVWERGSGITQACGTGACASVVAAILNGFFSKNERIQVILEGGQLEIFWASNNNVYMTGPAVTVATGNILL